MKRMIKNSKIFLEIALFVVDTKKLKTLKFNTFSKKH